MSPSTSKNLKKNSQLRVKTSREVLDIEEDYNDDIQQSLREFDFNKQDRRFYSSDDFEN